MGNIKKRSFRRRNTQKYRTRVKPRQLPLNTKFSAVVKKLEGIRLEPTEILKLQRIKYVVNDNTYRILLEICKKYGLKEKDIVPVF